MTKLSDSKVSSVTSQNYTGVAVAGQTIIIPGFSWRTVWSGRALYISGVKQAPNSYTVNSIGGGLSSQITLSEALVGGETIDFTALDISAVPSLQGIVDTLALQSTQITNAGMGVWSNGTLESAISSVDLLGGTGNFESPGDVSTWSPINSAILAIAGAPSVNGTYSMAVTNAGATAGGATKAITTVPGNVYKLVASCYVSTASSSQVRAGTTSGAADVGYILNQTIGSFVRSELVFEAVGTTTYVSLATGHAVNGGVNYFDQATLYDMGANLITNGTFNSNTTGWINGASNTISSVAGGINGNCGQVSNTEYGYTYQQITDLTIGKLYRISAFMKNGSAIGPHLGIDYIAGPSGSITAFNPTLSTVTSFTFFSSIFEATSTSIYINLQGLNVGTYLFDSITLTEVTVGCVDYNTKALDLWTKDLAAVCFRETINTKAGSYYALRVYNGAVYWSDGGRGTKSEFYFKYASRPTTLGMWVRCSSASKARIGITDSAGTTWSSYHSGGGSYEWLEVTRTPDTGITSFNVVVDSGTGTEAQFSQPQLMFGTSVGTGNFVPIPDEIIRFDDIMILSKKFPGTGQTSSTGTINVSADSAGTICRGAKAVSIRYLIGDGASAGATALIALSPVMGSWEPSSDVYTYLTGYPNNSQVNVNGVLRLTLSNTFSYKLISSGSSTLVVFLMYNGVQL